MISFEKLQSLLDRFDLVQAQLAGQLDRDTFVQYSREFAELEPVASKINEINALAAEQKDLEHILSDRDAGRDMQELADEEIKAVRDRLEAAQHQLQLLLLPKDAADDRSVILEVRAGTGGDEAALFAGDLFRMYQRHADLHRWKVEVLSANESELGGYREIIASITGKGVYARLKYESGGHRVQRVPETEAGGRIHTSAATVAVLPEAEDVDVKVEDKDLRIDVYRSSGAGGQHVNTTDSAVRITHMPSGLVVAVQDERSQHKNKARAMQLLRARLYDMERQRLDAERAASRKGQIGSGDRSERIRTYNFPQGRVTDHRINLTLYKLDKVIAGEALDELIDALTTEAQAAQLAALEN